MVEIIIVSNDRGIFIRKKIYVGWGCDENLYSNHLVNNSVLA